MSSDVLPQVRIAVESAASGHFYFSLTGIRRGQFAIIHLSNWSDLSFHSKKL